MLVSQTSMVIVNQEQFIGLELFQSILKAQESSTPTTTQGRVNSILSPIG